MALTGMHVACGYAGTTPNPNNSYPISGEVIWSQTFTSAGTTSSRSPTLDDGSGRPIFMVYSAVDAYVALASASPDASASPRRFIPALTPVEFYADFGDYLAWVAA